MKKLLAALSLLIGLSAGAYLTEFPEAIISNGLINARFYLPDTTKGYYRGARFDWSGVIARLDYQGHSYFGEWFEKYDPKIHDAITGPVEDFTPLKFKETKAGDHFLKIGIGMLGKPDDLPYRFSTPYKIVNAGKWTCQRKKKQIEFIHRLSDTSGYAYVYSKTVKLLKDKPVLVLEHLLRNTGTKSIETEVYNHNFFVLDNEPTGIDHSVTFSFQPRIKGNPRGLGTLATIQNKSIHYLRQVNKGENTHFMLEGFGTGSSDYDIKVENKKTGAGVRITSDQPLSDLVFWSAARVLSPEPYIHIKAEPGQEFRWRIFYEFYTVPTVSR